VVADESTLFECSQEDCGHVFHYAPPLLRGGEQETSRSASPQNVSLPENDTVNSQEEEEPTLETIAPKPSRLPKSLAKKSLATSQGTKRARKSEDPEEFSSEEFIHEEGTERSFATDHDDAYEEPAFISRSTARAKPEIAFSVRPLLAFLGIIVLSYGALGAYSLSHLTDTETALARLPLLGSLFTTERFSGQHIALTDLKGGFWLTKDNRRVFAISGKATNGAIVPALSIQIEGMVYNTAGQVTERQTVFCGTETTALMLSSLTVREISILQNLVPPKQFNVPAGQSVNFLIVFPNPPPAVSEISCRVMAARFGAA
jgi:hypothetical protein